MAGCVKGNMEMLEIRRRSSQPGGGGRFEHILDLTEAREAHVLDRGAISSYEYFAGQRIRYLLPALRDRSSRRGLRPRTVQQRSLVRVVRLEAKVFRSREMGTKSRFSWFLGKLSTERGRCTPWEPRTSTLVWGLVVFLAAACAEADSGARTT